MKKSDIKNIKSTYTEFNNLLFGGMLPDASEINFILHAIPGAAGYSKYSKVPTKNGNHHTIAFAKFLKLTDKQITETLIHEMIHLWQVYSVKQERYEYCTNAIAHDRVFRGKMATINLILQKYCYDLQITEVFESKVIYDDEVNAKTPFNVIFAKLQRGAMELRGFIKVHQSKLRDIEKFLEDNSEDFNILEKYTIKTTDAVFNRFPFCKKSDINFISADVDNEDLFETYKTQVIENE